jgi:lysyl-tRNA synthetase class I
MHDLKQITENAVNYLKAFYPESLNVQVDEMEISEDRKQCFITINYEVVPNTPSEMLSVKKTLKQKIFQVELKSGDVLSMKNVEEF